MCAGPCFTTACAESHRRTQESAIPRRVDGQRALASIARYLLYELANSRARFARFVFIARAHRSRFEFLQSSHKHCLALKPQSCKFMQCNCKQRACIYMLQLVELKLKLKY